ncbi:hypothetical protein F-VV57_0499 [Faustovirus]|nr:hypothetical protein F-VV57_0499 [Faustovirus]QJX73767.1 hypothetical protein F-VV63_0501 [Faustovirus]
MNNCVFPIEIIREICCHNYTNWVNLIATCRTIYGYLYDLRWEVKTALIKPHVELFEENEPYWIVKWQRGQHCRSYTVEYMADYWQIWVINHYQDERTHGESIYFRHGISVYCYNAGVRIGWYSDISTFDGTNIYEIHDNVLTCKRSTKAEITELMDTMGIGYNWFKYLPDA